LLIEDCVTAYYSHPWAWDEIGFGGPAYPRGYMRIENGLPEPWEKHSNDMNGMRLWIHFQYSTSKALLLNMGRYMVTEEVTDDASSRAYADASFAHEAIRRN
jgi:hypothetical protein